MVYFLLGVFLFIPSIFLFICGEIYLLNWLLLLLASNYRSAICIIGGFFIFIQLLMFLNYVCKFSYIR